MKQGEALWGALIICGFMIFAGFILSLITESVMSLANISNSMRDSAAPYLRVILFGAGSNFDLSGDSVDWESVCVRPAMWVKL